VLYAQEGGPQIDVEGVVKLLDARLVDRAPFPYDARVVEHDVQLAILLHCGVDSCRDVGLLGDVTPARMRQRSWIGKVWFAMQGTCALNFDSNGEFVPLGDITSARV
jgi:hypothetical protein